MTLHRNKIKIKNRLRWNQAARSPLPPALIGLVSFSFVTVAFGAAVYVAAVPGMIQQSPVVEAATNAIEDSGIPEAISGAFSNGGGFNEASVLSSEASSFETIDASSSGFSSIDASAPTEGEENNPNDGQSSTTEPSKPDDSIDENPEEPVEPAGPSMEEEAQFHAALVNAYNALPSYEQAVSNCIQEFNSQCLNPSQDQRYATFQNAAGVAYDISLASSNISQLKIPRDSRWYAASQAVQGLYNDLYGSAGLIQRCWLLNVQLDDPEPYKDQWMQPLTEHLVDGQIDMLIDYQQRKPQVGAML